MAVEKTPAIIKFVDKTGELGWEKVVERLKKKDWAAQKVVTRLKMAATLGRIGCIEEFAEYLGEAVGTPLVENGKGSYKTREEAEKAGKEEGRPGLLNGRYGVVVIDVWRAATPAERAARPKEPYAREWKWTAMRKSVAHRLETNVAVPVEELPGLTMVYRNTNVIGHGWATTLTEEFARYLKGRKTERIGMVGLAEACGIVGKKGEGVGHGDENH